MAPKSQQIAEMIDMLPEQDQQLAFELVKKLVLAWDPDFTKLTPAERERLEAARQSGYVDAQSIDFDHLENMSL